MAVRTGAINGGHWLHPHVSAGLIAVGLVLENDSNPPPPNAITSLRASSQHRRVHALARRCHMLSGSQVPHDVAQRQLAQEQLRRWGQVEEVRRRLGGDSDDASGDQGSGRSGVSTADLRSLQSPGYGRGFAVETRSHADCLPVFGSPRRVRECAGKVRVEEGCPKRCNPVIQPRFG